MKKGLGRGFDSLIPTTLIDEAFDPTAAQDDKLSRLQEIVITDISPDPEQPRRFFDEVALRELSASISEHGVLQPIVVSPQGKKFVIVAGERRWRAAKLANLESVPALVRTLSGQHRLEISLIENLQRRDLNAIETATAYLKLRDQFNMTLDKIGERVGGKSASAISNTLRLLKLPKTAQEAVFSGKLSEGQARPMIGLPEDISEELLARIIKDDWSARRIEQWVAEWKTGANSSVVNESSPKIQPIYRRAMANFKDHLKAPVDIRTNQRGSGKIIISFKNEEDFERIKKLLDN